MGLSTKAELIEKASLYILDFLVQSYGEDKYTSIKTKIIIKSILKNDEKKVRKTFILPSETALIDEVLYFLYHVVFVNTEYFSTEKLSVEQENNLWEKFLSNCTEKMDIWKESKSHLIACVNYHNNEICRRLIDDMSLLNLKISERDNKGFENLLFTTKFGTPICDQIMIDSIKRIVDEINISRDELEQFEYFSPHCFRHTFATRCFESDIAPKMVQQFLGHATLQMTMDLYTHVLDDQKQEAMSKLGDTLDRVFDGGESIIEAKFVKEQKEREKIVSFSSVG